MGNLESITFAWNFWFVLRKCMWVKTSDFANPIVFTLQTDHAKKKVWHKIQKILHNVCVLKEWNNYDDKRTNGKANSKNLHFLLYPLYDFFFFCFFGEDLKHDKIRSKALNKLFRFSKLHWIKYAFSFLSSRIHYSRQKIKGKTEF